MSFGSTLIVPWSRVQDPPGGISCFSALSSLRNVL
ncbi:MAG TPA: hypothetical protein EYO33_20445 [Phycisphaerales bacterium]|nr:hypothetical protein [Phycisphaerales bacterium]